MLFLKPEERATVADEAALVRQAFGADWNIAEAQALNDRPDVRVARLLLSNGTDTRSAVLKQRLVAEDEEADFGGESAAYVFLDRLEPRFSFCPRLLARTRDMLLLEDLGEDSYAFPDTATLVSALAHTFAKLHVHTAGKEPLYKAVRTRLGLPPAEGDLRRYSAVNSKFQASGGAAFLVRHARALQADPDKRLPQDLNKIITLITDEHSMFRAFVHDDLADRRQSVTIDGRVYLIDFEHGKYFHALMDLAKLLAGKVEKDSIRRGLRCNHPNIPPQELAAAYREARAACDHMRWSDEVWDEQLGAALIFQSLLNLERMHTGPEEPLLLSLAGTFRAVLTRLRETLEHNRSYESLRETLQLMISRIVV